MNRKGGKLVMNAGKFTALILLGGAIMARKFSKLSEKDLAIAVSRYNQMRTRYIKSGGKTVAPKITAQELKAQSENTAQLRQQIKRLNDYKKIADFESAKVKGFRFATTKGERRTISRLDRAARQRYKKEIAKLEVQKTTASNQELINKIIPAIEELKAKPTKISNIPNREILGKVQSRYEREQRYYKKYDQVESPILRVDHYLAAFVKVGCFSVSNGPLVYDALAKLSNEEWAKLIEDYLSIFDLDYLYDPGISAQAKVNAIANALQMVIYDDNLPDEI